MRDRRSPLAVVPIVVLVVLIVACIAVAGATRPATAAPPTEDDRRAAEEAFVRGRYDDVAVLLAGATTAEDAEPLAVLDLWWRPLGRAAPATGPATPLPGGRLARARRDRLRGAGGGPAPPPQPRPPARGPPRPGPPRYPMPGPDERDPWPRVTALVLDRLRRTTAGASGLPEESPLRALKDPYLDVILDEVAKPAYAGPQPQRWSPEDREAQRVVDAGMRRVAARNRLVALATLGILLAGAGFALRALRARPDPTDPPERGG